MGLDYINVDGKTPITKPPEFDPANVQAISRLIRQVNENGITPSPQTIGYHGTSLDTLQYILRTGRLPGASESYKDPNLPQIGDIYFIPIVGKIPSGITVKCEQPTTKDCFKQALILFYEQNSLHHVKRLFIEQLVFAYRTYFEE